MTSGQWPVTSRKKRGGRRRRSRAAAPEVLTPGKVRRGYWLPYQQKWIADESRILSGEKARQIGFTEAESYKATMPRLRSLRKLNYYFSSADHFTAREFVDRCAFWIRQAQAVCDRADVPLDYFDDEGKRQTVMVERIHFKETGCNIFAMTSNPRAMRGKKGDVTLDEFAHHDHQRAMYAAAAPVTTWGGRLAEMSTHNGEESLFNTHIKEAKLPPEERRRRHLPERSLHRVTIADAIEQGFVERRNEFSGLTETREEFLNWCRSLAGPDFEQEYMCVPQAAALAWLLWEVLAAISDPQCPRPDMPAHPGGDGLRYLGVDVGRTRDLTVIWENEKVGDVLWTRSIKTLAKMSLPDQCDYISAMLRQQPRIVRVSIDCTGLGLGLFEWLQKKFGPRVEGIVFGNASKEVLANDIRMAAEDKKWRIPDDSALHQILHSVTKTITPGTKSVRFDAERNDRGHADEFWAAALSIHAARSGQVCCGYVAKAGRWN